MGNILKIQWKNKLILTCCEEMKLYIQECNLKVVWSPEKGNVVVLEYGPSVTANSKLNKLLDEVLRIHPLNHSWLAWPYKCWFGLTYF